MSALHVLIYIATKFKGPFSADSFALMQDLLKACDLERQVDLNRMLQQSRPAFIIVAQQLAKGSSQLSDMQKRLLFKCAIQLMYINQYGYLDFQRQTEDFCTFLNISFPDVQKAIEEALTEQTQQTEETAPDEDVEPLNDELLKACQLLDLQPHQLNSSSLQTAYRRKIAEFHPDQYQSLPQAVRQLIEQQAQQLNQARDLLRSYLQAG
ncbi:J domain-containing protein [Acinetobacter sp. ANC 4636]